MTAAPFDPARYGFPNMKYAVIERERRWLCGPDALTLCEGCEEAVLNDLYVTSSRLRLRTQIGTHETIYKLSRKADTDRPDQRLISTLYLSPDEMPLFAGLSGAKISKTRYRVPYLGRTIGIDVFHAALKGLVLAEAEFTTNAEMASFQPAPFFAAEVTADPRYTGGALATLSRDKACELIRSHSA